MTMFSEVSVSFLLGCEEQLLSHIRHAYLTSAKYNRALYQVAREASVGSAKNYSVVTNLLMAVVTAGAIH